MYIKGILNCYSVSVSRTMTNKKGSKLRRYMKSLVRLLSKPKDMYVHAMTTCSSHFPCVDTTMGFPAPTLPRSSSVGSTATSHYGDLKLLLMGSSSGRSIHGSRLHLDRGRRPLAAEARMPRSCGIGIGRIDEDKPCEFEHATNVKPLMISPRSRSYAVHGRGARVF